MFLQTEESLRKLVPELVYGRLIPSNSESTDPTPRVSSDGQTSTPLARTEESRHGQSISTVSNTMSNDSTLAAGRLPVRTVHCQTVRPLHGPY